MTRTSVLASALLLSVLALVSPRASAADTGDWPGWQGVNRDGKSTDKGLLKSWPATGPKLLWTATGTGQGFASVCVVDGTVYTSGMKNNRLLLIAIGANGQTKWSKEVGPAFTASYPGARSTPTYDNGLLYLESGTGTVGCYTAANGAEKWTRSLSEFGGQLPRWGFAESVLIAGELAVVTPGGHSCLVALDKKTGKTVWESDAFGGAHYSSPIFAQYRNVPMIVNGTGRGLIAVNAKNGTTLWTNAFAANNTANCPTPAYADDYVFWATGYGKGGICLKLTSSEGGVAAKPAWNTADMNCHHGGYVILGGYVYGNNGNGWVCLDLKTGQKKWENAGVGKGSVCTADGMLYLFGENGGKMGLAPASPEGFQLTGEFSIHGTGPSWAHPVVAGGRLYLRYDDHLYCYDVRAGATP